MLFSWCETPKPLIKILAAFWMHMFYKLYYIVIANGIFGQGFRFLSIEVVTWVFYPCRINLVKVPRWGVVKRGTVRRWTEKNPFLLVEKSIPCNPESCCTEHAPSISSPPLLCVWALISEQCKGMLDSAGVSGGFLEWTQAQNLKVGKLNITISFLL